MAVNYFSDLYADLATPSTLDLQKRAGAGIGHGRLRYALARFVPGEAVSGASILRLKTLKSGDRIASILLSSNDSGDTGAINFGLYNTGEAHDGAELDRDVFAGSVDINAAALSQIEIIGNGGFGAVADHFDHGKKLWDLMGQTVDPMEEWDVSVFFASLTTNAAFEMMVEIFYTSGD